MGMYTVHTLQERRLVYVRSLTTPEQESIVGAKSRSSDLKEEQLHV